MGSRGAMELGEMIANTRLDTELACSKEWIDTW